jgi:hypothetical protein
MPLLLCTSPEIHSIQAVINVGGEDSEFLNCQVATLQNVSTIAIFCSGVSATTLQYSGQLQHPGFATPYNFLWLVSLVLSTTCAMQCQLAIYWHTSRRQRPTTYTTFPTTYASTEFTSALLLGASTTAFMWGLACFTFIASSPRSYLAIGVTVAIGVVGTWVGMYFLCMVVVHLHFRIIPKLQARRHRHGKEKESV